MRLTYIFHSGFALETERCVVVFDYWLDPAGVVRQLLTAGKPLYVLVSHFHEDHFNRDVFAWRTAGADVTYLLSKDILRHRRSERNEADAWLAKGGCWHDSRLRVTAAGSTDSGVSWVLEVEGLRIFHAGDLNNWYARFLTGCGAGCVAHSTEWDVDVDPVCEEKRYLGELKDLRKLADGFDVAMFPVDSRIGNGYTRGARQFLDRFRTGLFVPMHFVAGGFASAWRMRELAAARGADFWEIAREGEMREL